MAWMNEQQRRFYYIEWHTATGGMLREGPLTFAEVKDRFCQVASRSSEAEIDHIEVRGVLVDIPRL